MKYAVLLAGVLTAGIAIVATGTNPTAQASERVCLRIRDLGNLKPIDDKTLLAKSRSQGDFIVKLRHPCRDFKQISNYYVVRVMSNQECFDGDDVLQFRYGGVCFVQSVTPVK